MKKQLAIGLAALLTAASLAGCGSSSGSGTAATAAKTEGETAAEASDSATSETSAPTSGQESTDKSDVTLTVAIWDKGQQPGLQKIMDDFTAKTGIKTDIQITPYKDYWTMLEAAATGGNLPDVFWMHTFQVATYAQYDDLLMNLSDRIANDPEVDMSKYPEEFVKAFQNPDGDQIGIPKDRDTAAVWYNKDMFDEAGIPYPTADWTWDDFREDCKKLTKADGSQYGLAMKPGSDQEGWYGTIYAYGGYVISDDMKKSGFDDPNTLKGLDVIQGIIDDGSMPPYSQQADNDPLALQEAGTVAMTFQGSWAASELSVNDYLKEHIAIAPLPKGPEGAVTMSNSLAWSGSAQSGHQDEAWELIKYLTGEEAQKKQAELGVTLSAYDGASDAWAKSQPGFDLQPYLDAMDNAVLYPHSKNTNVWYTMMKEKLVSVWDGSARMDDTAKDIAKEMNADLAEE